METSSRRRRRSERRAKPNGRGIRPKRDLFGYIERFYDNAKRWHSTIGYVTPAERSSNAGRISWPQPNRQQPSSESEEHQTDVMSRCCQ